MIEGHDAKGRFVKGCKGGPGNPNLSALRRWRNIFQSTVTEQDVRRCISILVYEANVNKEKWAIESLLDRCLGKPTSPIEINDYNLEHLKIELSDETPPDPDPSLPLDTK
jgi:hypothetical protein